MLPEAVRVLHLQRVPVDYNVRFTLGKTYYYDLHLDEHDPFTCRYRCIPDAPGGVDLQALADAARLFVGTHDFTAFCSASEDGRRRSRERCVSRLEVRPLPGGARLVVQGDGFLYKQVRHMVGALLAVGVGRLGADDIAAALAGAEAAGQIRRGRRGYTVAPSRGLCLAHVELPVPADPEVLQYPQGAPLMRREELLALRAAPSAA